MSHRVAILSLALLSTGPTALGADATPVPADIAAAIRRLTDDSYANREAATEFLWAAGEAALPALQQAVIRGAPETRTRAMEVVEKLKYGLFPDTPPEVVDLVGQYIGGDDESRRGTISTLADKGGYGIVVLARLESTDADPARHEQIITLLNSHAATAAESAMILLANGEPETAARLLAQASSVSSDEAPVRAYAAWLASDGKLAATVQALDELAATGSKPWLPWRLALMHRANGDLAGAQAWADKSGDARLIENFLLERRDWPRLQKALGPADSNEDLRRTGFIAAVQQFAGDDAAFKSSIARLRILSNRIDTQSQAEMALLLNNQVDDALAIQLDRRAYLSAFDIYVYTGRFKEAVALVEKAVDEHHPDTPKLMAVAVPVLWRLGEKERAQLLLNTAESENGRLKDFGVAILLCEAHKLMGHTERLRDESIAALKMAGHRDNLPWLFSKLFPGQDQAADIWWLMTLNQKPEQAVEQTYARFTQLLGNQLTATELEAVCASMMAKVTQADDVGAMDRALQLVSDLLHTAGHDKAANAYLAQLTTRQESRGDWLPVAERRLAKKDWLGAAEAYKRAAIHPSDTPEAVWLRGYCLEQAGQQKVGKQMMEKAKLIPLGDPQRRQDLAAAMASRDDDSEAHVQHELILRTGPSRDRHFYESCKHLGNDASHDKDLTTATGYWQLFMLQVLDDGGTFTNPRAYLDLPQLVHRNRARALISTGDISGAMRELQIYQVIAAPVATLVTDFSPLLEKAGHPQEARALCDTVLSRLIKTSDDFPRCAYLHNDIAWAATLANQQPELALHHALRAVELTPTDTNSLDTLAEIHFRAGRLKEARSTIQKCIELEPTQDRHRKRLEGFNAGKGFTP